MPATFRPEQPAKVIRVLSDDGTLDPPLRSAALSENEVIEILPLDGDDAAAR
ncbi:MAG: hypothetical protein WDO74_36850 [Pseudomonadota bacterium]